LNPLTEELALANSSAIEVGSFLDTVFVLTSHTFFLFDSGIIA
jgi:hypothetical protein